MNQRQHEALYRVLEYIREDEQEDYLNQDMPEDHIYHDLMELARFLDEELRKLPDFKDIIDKQIAQEFKL